MTTATRDSQTLSALLDWYATLTPQSLYDLPRFYAEDARFTDPFNSVRGHAAIQALFAHMFETVDVPRFAIQRQVMGDQEAFATWVFTGAVRGHAFSVPGSTHLQFDDDGRVCMHCDYWDAAALWRQLPVIGAPVRWLQRHFAAPPTR
ncbi:nuclear transport factor 2 family protein [Cupriavidus plantarum]|uniref:SnoaL-like protein n=1 Tax=Cupriavidus plantarum TaxID=942865 RepID=A0A316ERR1_9BURK|nr:nuclear transport factor 2 family protein [Cupriavidus plantarum]NYI01676.1 hypothetical protein [Cupriavidus plantarum]PWK33812.1 SnoaL-like protein [Cupriavidus plantarum]REE90989.1 SnoaL-like protein [Cupriavidus plantarum]RLK33661.1 SnoaL-like protein [Cupriavidus plantarum]CAG2148259.1 hypothetical protein LMG26296_04294 [Cupriavidus plantarum]